MAGNGISRRTFLYTTAALSATATLGTVLGGTDPAFAAINSRVAWDFFIAKGLTAVQAAGVLGNLAQESNIDPLAQEPGGPGRGIAQWSAGGRWDATPNANATWYAASTGQSVWSLRAQLEFIWWELTNIPAYGLAELKGAATIAAATIVFQNRFERCGTCHQATRISYATNYYNQYAGTVTP
ncbi:phage tail tip lysozyme, partial [Micromonospora sp. NPDC049060]|uniref:phage tail tip lysozyme n=1 Tax=Micromonospora sp. NPDC049060 TaxID=3154828 RepID=UPI0033E5A17C